MTLPKGFLFSSAHCGIKASRKDVALIVSTAPAVFSAQLTLNQAKAAPIQHLLRLLEHTETIRAVLVNSGNANALTGAQGILHVEQVCNAVASTLFVEPNDVCMLSTGVIGVPLPVQKIVDASSRLASSLGPSPEGAAEAMMTTDTRVKVARRTLNLPDHPQPIRIVAIAKGSGMVAPSLATILVVIATDAAIEKKALDSALKQAVTVSFNALNIDDCMSTNDAVIALANALCSNELITDGTPDHQLFSACLSSICVELARAIAEDGEGATKFLEVSVCGANSDEEALLLARSISGCALVKASVFGADANWGRILATVGAQIGAKNLRLNAEQTAVRIQDVEVYNGGPSTFDPSSLRAKMRAPSVRIDVKFHDHGLGKATSFGCDMSYDYVKINADYISLISTTADGLVSKDDRLTNYSPAFKRTLLVEALSYLSRLRGQRVVIKSPSAIVRESLKISFAEDIRLLLSAGLHPVVVHSGGDELAYTLQKLGVSSVDTEWIHGTHVANSSDLHVLEMVLTGKVNSELVSLINSDKARAVGLSGKDGGLLRAKPWSETDRPHDHLGHVSAVNTELLEILVERGYVPVIAPLALGDNGESFHVSADEAAAEVAIALRADKLMTLMNVQGIMDAGELLPELSATELQKRIHNGVIQGKMQRKAPLWLRALAHGVASVHVIDGRTPHSLIAELFTDRGVGTLIRGSTPNTSNPIQKEFP